MEPIQFNSIRFNKPYPRAKLLSATAGGAASNQLYLTLQNVKGKKLGFQQNPRKRGTPFSSRLAAMLSSQSSTTVRSTEVLQADPEGPRNEIVASDENHEEISRTNQQDDEESFRVWTDAIERTISMTSLSGGEVWLEKVRAALRAAKQRRNACFKGLVRAIVVLRRMRLRASQTVYAPGGTGFAAAAASFNETASFNAVAAISTGTALISPLSSPVRGFSNQQQ